MPHVVDNKEQTDWFVPPYRRATHPLLTEVAEGQGQNWN